jgi:Ca-activated chloride channel family protein
MPVPEMIRVEEYINYHRHRLPLPKKGSRVHLDLQQMKLENGKTVVQVGLTTPRALENDKIPPMNMVLVIDRSGSMGGDRIANVKKAIGEMIEQFRELDNVTIVGFSNTATVHLVRLSQLCRECDKVFQGLE